MKFLPITLPVMMMIMMILLGVNVGGVPLVNVDEFGGQNSPPPSQPPPPPPQTINPWNDEHIFLFKFFKKFDSTAYLLSESCRQSYNYFRDHWQEEWALKMIDANSALEPGITQGNLQFFGAYDECVNLKIELSAAKRLLNDAIQYCTVSFPASILLNENESKLYPPFFFQMFPPTAGLCLPAGCSAKRDLPIILNHSLNQTETNLITVSECTTRNDLNIRNRIEPIHIIIINAFAAIILLMAVGTILEQFEMSDSNVLCKFCLCFGLVRNLRFLFNLPVVGKPKTPKGQPPANMNKPPQVNCLHGIRVLSFVFILAYHTFTEAQVPSANLLEVFDAETSFLWQLITNAALWVDTFFLLSGFLVAHSQLYQRNDKNPTPGLWDTVAQHPKRVFHRYIRLTPSVAGVVALSILLEIVGSGPLWINYVQLSRSSCHKHWWNVFLYVNNVCQLNSPAEPQNECLSYLWYLAVDMQLFIISPLLIMFLIRPESRMQNIGLLINGLIIIISWTVTALLMAWQHLTPTVLVNVYDLNYINMIYKASYCRIAPYCIGILLAYFLRKRQLKRQQDYLVEFDDDDDPDKRRGNWKTGLMLLLTSTTMMLAVTFLTYPWLSMDADYDNIPSIVYGTVHRSVWALAWALFVWCLARRHLPLVDDLFSHPWLQIFSKLTYQSYLLHSVLISALINSVRQKFYFSLVNFLLEVITYYCLTQLVAMVAFVMFERPFLNIETTFIRSNNGNRTKPVDQSRPPPPPPPPTTATTNLTNPSRFFFLGIFH